MNRNPSIPPCTLRPGTEADADALVRLTCELGYPAVTAEVMRQRIRTVTASPADLLLVAEAGGALAGWLHAQTAHLVESGFRAEILGLVVSSSVRRGGVGRALVAAAEAWAKAQGAPVLVVRSNVRRQESHAFYPALGFVAAKTQQVYRKPLADA